MFSLPAQPVCDYITLMDELKDYTLPRDKVKKEEPIDPRAGSASI